MTDRPTPTPPEDDPVLAAAGTRLRSSTGGLDPGGVRAGALGRRNRRLRVVSGVSLAVASVLAGVLVAGAVGDEGGRRTGSGRSVAGGGEIEAILSDLPDRPVDPTEVKLVRTVSTFDSCGALVGELRRVGAAHVGSRGFGGNDLELPYAAARHGWAAEESADVATSADGAGAPAGETVGTNVQVAGVDELDHVKAEGALVYDLDLSGRLRITDVRAGEVLGSLDVAPRDDSWVDQMLVDDGHVAVFGSEVEISEPVEGDPSATRSQTSYLTIALVDATEPTAPRLVDRVRVEGSLVSARLVDGEVRLVTAAHMADLGFVLPTTPNSVPKALDANRRAVAGSEASDWIPEWGRDGGDERPLVPCERVHVPDTFAGVAMTSMVTFPIDGEFDPVATSILAPGETLYAGLDRIAISSAVWVDPIDREGLEVDSWETAVHEFTFEADDAPAYRGSGIVDGSVVGQFAFGEIGDALAIVTSAGTPWRHSAEAKVDLTLMRSDDDALREIGRLADLAEGGGLTAVRFTEDRVLVSTGWNGRRLHVVDATDPSAPRSAGTLELPGDAGYLHPLPDDRALVIGTRADTVEGRHGEEHRPWAQAHLVDVTDPDAPHLVDTWERPWSGDEVGADHHAFTWWAERDLALWGVFDMNWMESAVRPNHAAVLRADDGLEEIAVPQASEPPEMSAPCTVLPDDPRAREMLGPDAKVLSCEDPRRSEVEWSRWSCWRIEDGLVEQYAPELADGGSHFACSPAGPPRVSRVLIVEGTPVLHTDQTLEVLDPETFESRSVLYHPSAIGGPGPLW